MINKKNKDAIQLVLFAAASLYLELAVIRFTAAEVLYLGYFSNFILISAFVGLGLGFLSYKSGYELDQYFPFVMLFLFSLVLVSKFDVTILQNHFGEFFFGNIQGRAGLPGAFLLLALLFSTVVLFAGLGGVIARSFDKFQPLKAYTLDISGSLLGILLFSLHSLVSSTPITWVITASLLIILGYLVDKSRESARRAGTVMAACICVVVIMLSAQEKNITVWSTYQKLEIMNYGPDGPQAVFANGILHQYMNRSEVMIDTYYGVPYKIRGTNPNPLDDVLIIGAGTGTDVAVALRAGARSVDAVDIDGKIVDIGKVNHPDQPYSDPRVSIHITDGRQFLRNTDKKYDVIVFALPDSLVRLSAMASVRLESYLFTLEAMEDARQSLKEGGLFVMYNQYRWEWLINKLGSSLKNVFGEIPLIVHDGITTVLAIGDDVSGDYLDESGFTRLATDDWPFVYVQEPGIHWMYIGMIMTFIVVALLGVFLLAPSGTLMNPDGQFFFMGVAFLLLETKSIAFFSLLFGTTWFVNSLAFAGILLSVLVANLTVQYFKISNRYLLYAGLFIALLLAYLVPASTFLNIETGFLRYILAVCLMFTPIFFANLVFSREFRDVNESTRAFGWNLLGAVLGGGLEYLSLVTGFNNLLIIVAFCYMFAAFFTYRGNMRLTFNSQYSG